MAWTSDVQTGVESGFPVGAENDEIEAVCLTSEVRIEDKKGRLVLVCVHLSLKISNRRENMAAVEILYWQEIPSQIRVKEGDEKVNMELDHRMQERIDEVATERGIVGSDEYIEAWHWEGPEERPGSAQEVADALKKELEDKFLSDS